MNTVHLRNTVANCDTCNITSFHVHADGVLERVDGSQKLPLVQPGPPLRVPDHVVLQDLCHIINVH